MQPTITNAITAYELARVRAAAAAEVRNNLFQHVLHQAQEDGLSVREAARLLGIPKSTVARHRIAERVPASSSRRSYASAAYYVEAYNAAWPDNPEEHITEWSPLTRVDAVGTNVLRPAGPNEDGPLRFS